MSKKLYTVKSGEVKEGATVVTFQVKPEISIPAIIIGEEGRGRKLSVLPVALLPNEMAEWKEKRRVQILFAEVGQTRAGKPKLFQKANGGNDNEIIVVLETKIGFRGSNSHTGDISEINYVIKYDEYGYEQIARELGIIEGYDKKTFTPEQAKEVYKDMLLYNVGKRHFRLTPEEIQSGDHMDLVFEPVKTFRHFPGKTLTKGVIAQGDAGSMGSGEQLIAVVPSSEVFRTRYTGRLYGAPSEHYYKMHEGKLHAFTLEEREVIDIF